MPKFNEVKTLFTLDTKGFDGAIKNANKSVDTVKKSINDTKKDLLGFQKALNDISGELKEINKLDVDFDIKDDIIAAKKEVESVKKLFNEIKKDADSFKDSFKDFDLSSITKAEQLISKMKDTSLIDMSNLQKATNSVDQMVSKLKTIDLDMSHKLEIAASPLADSGLRHWIDNNGSGMNQAADDTHKVLQDILNAIKNPTQNASHAKQPDVNVEGIDTTPLVSLNTEFGKVTDAIEKGNQSINHLADNMNTAWSNTSEYAKQLTKLKDEFADLGKIIEETMSAADVLDDDINIPEYATDGFSNISDEAEQIAKTIKEVYENLRRVVDGPIEEFDDRLSALKAGFDTISAETDKWNSKLLNTTEEVNKVQRELEALNQTFASMPEDHSDYEQTRRALEAKEKEYRLLVRRQTLEERITNELRIQTRETSEAFNEQRNQYSQMQRQLSAEQRETAQQERQAELLRQQQQEASKLKNIFNNIVSTIRPFSDLFGGDRVTSSISEIGQAASSSAEGVRNLGQGISSVRDASGVAAGASAGLVVAIGAVAAAVIAAIAAFKAYIEIVKATIKVMQATITEFMSFESSMAKVAAACRMTAEEYRGFKDEFKDGFASQGYTEDANAYAESLQKVKQQLESIQAIDTEAVNKKVFTIQSVTGYDPNEIIRATRNMVINLGTDVDTALDMIMSAYQKTGDPMNDLLDTMQEYPSQMQKMGVSAEYFYHAITKGSEAGVYNTDKIADTLKEFYLRVTEKSDTVIQSMNDLGLSTQKSLDAFSEGGPKAEAALNNVITAIANVDDKAKQQTIIANLFGAPGEDVGRLFFETMAEAEIVMDEFNGSVADSAAIMENTLGYQVTELKNAFATLKTEVGDSFAPVLKEIVADVVANMDEIKSAVMDNLIPAFQTLFITISDPFVNGEEASDSFIINLINGVANAIEGIAVFINVMNGVIAVFRILGNTIEIVWNFIQIILVGFVGLFNNVLYGIGIVIGAIIDGFTGLVANAKTAAQNVGIAFENCAIGIYNIFGWAFSGIQKGAAAMLNKLIEGFNKIPGIDIDYRASWGSGYEAKDFKTFKSFDNEGTNIAGLFADKLYESNRIATNLLEKNWSDLAKDWDDLKDAASDLGNTFTFDKRIEEAKKKIEDLRKQQQKVASAQDKVNQKIEKFNTDKSTAGKDKTQKELAEAQKELNDELEKQKDLEKEILEEKKRQLEVAKQHANNIRSWTEEIISQQVKLKTSKEEAYLFEMNAIEQIKQTYILTADQMISYTQKQFDLALNLKEYYTDKYKAAIQKEIDAVKNRAKEEYEIEKKKNDKLIKDKERQIKAIDALLRENEYNENQEDLDYEIKQTEEELQKYLYATSFEGINKRNELEERLREFKLEKERAAKKEELESQKQNLQDEIDNIKEADEEAQKAAEEKAAAMEKIYDEMFKELEKAMTDGMTDIGLIQQLAQKETNTTIKGLLDEYVTNYKNATDKIAQYTLSMNQILGWNNTELKNNITEGLLTGDDKLVANSQDLLDKNNSILNAEEKEEARQKYNALKKQHSILSSQKNPDKTQIAAIEKEVAALRKKWGFTGYEAQASRIAVPQIQLPDYNNALNRQITSLDTRNTSNQTSVVNNNGALLNIEHFNNNSNADIRRIAQELNSNVAIKNRSKGVRS